MPFKHHCTFAPLYYFTNSSENKGLRPSPSYPIHPAPASPPQWALRSPAPSPFTVGPPGSIPTQSQTRVRKAVISNKLSGRVGGSLRESKATHETLHWITVASMHHCTIHHMRPEVTTLCSGVRHTSKRFPGKVPDHVGNNHPFVPGLTLVTKYRNIPPCAARFLFRRYPLSARDAKTRTAVTGRIYEIRANPSRAV